MNYIYLKEFLENTEQVIYDTLEVDELTRISTEKGGVILMTEDEFDYMLQMIANRRCVYDPDRKR